MTHMSADETETNSDVVPLAPRPVAEGRGSPRDEAAHVDGRMMHELSALNYQLGRYVLRYYDADAGRAEPIPVADELALANSMAAAAKAIRARATLRDRHDDEPR